MKTISYAITVSTEWKELHRLLQNISPHVREVDEIVILIDASNTNNEVTGIIMEHRNTNPNINTSVFSHSLDKDFAKFKNIIKDRCNKDYIFFIDADEYPSEILIENMEYVLEANPSIDVFYVPRVNTVEGLTEQHIQKWGWRVNDKGWVNWPDYQMRICKNVPEIKWVGKVHERLEGWKSITQLPIDSYAWALMHPKDIQRQEKQNEFYNKIV